MARNVEDKKRELMELQSSIKQDEEREYRYRKCKSELARVEDHLTDLEASIHHRQAEIDEAGENMSKEMLEKYRYGLHKMFDEQMGLQKQREMLLEQLSVLERERPTQSNRNFDKYPCLANIRTLVEQKGVKLGDIERAAGMTAGYMSRLEKEDNNSDPSVEFLVTAAKMLDVGVEELMYRNFRKLPPNEEKVFMFLQKLLDDTKENKLHWTLKSVSEIKKELNISGNDDLANLRVPPMKIERRQDDIYADSVFEVGTANRIDGPWIYCQFSQEATVQIIRLGVSGNPHYEMFLYSAVGTIHPLMRTKLMQEDQLKGALIDLYNFVNDANANVRLSPGIESMIDAFLQ